MTQTNYALTYFADHNQGFSHHAIKRYLEEDKIAAWLVWENVCDQGVRNDEGYLAFDDMVLDKDSSLKVELVRPLDYRRYDSDDDGETKLDVERKLMLQIERLGKLFYYPLKTNRLADDRDKQQPYQPVDRLSWTKAEQQASKIVHLNRLPKEHCVIPFRVVCFITYMDYIATKELDRDSTLGTKQVCALRWKVEQFHREAKQLIGSEHSQCRLAGIQRNPMGCALLVWAALKRIAHQTGATIYQFKQGLLDDYMIAQHRSPTIPMYLA